MLTSYETLFQNEDFFKISQVVARNAIISDNEVVKNGVRRWNWRR